MRHSLMGGAVHDIAASRRNPAGSPGRSRTREPGPGTPRPRPPRHQADTHRRNLGRRRAVRRRPAADLHPGHSQGVSIGSFGPHGHLPLGVVLLLAVGLGVLLVVIRGTARTAGGAAGVRPIQRGHRPARDLALDRLEGAGLADGVGGAPRHVRAHRAAEPASADAAAHLRRPQPFGCVPDHAPGGHRAVRHLSSS